MDGWFVVQAPDGRFWDLGWHGWKGAPDWKTNAADAAQFTSRAVAERVARAHGGEVIELGRGDA